MGLADRYMLDTYEERLLRGSNTDLRLHHAQRTGRRGTAMLQGDYLRAYQDELNRRGPYWFINLMARLRPNHWWACTQFVISAAGAAIPLLRYFGH